MATKGSSFHIKLTAVTLFAHLLIIPVTALLLAWLLQFRGGLALASHHKYKTFNVHPLLMVIGFIVIAGEAIIACKTVQGKRRAKPLVHLILHFIAFAAEVFGVSIAFWYHQVENGRHIYTLHSWLGLSTICLFGLQWLLAFFTFWFPGVEKPRRRRLKPWHRFAGMAIFFMVVLAAVTGLVQSLVSWQDHESLIVNFTGLSIFLFATAVGLSVIFPSFLPLQAKSGGGSEPVISYPDLIVGVLDAISNNDP